MYLRRLENHGAAGLAEWREMWNEEVLPRLRSLRPLAGQGICTEEQPDGTVITALPVPSAPVSADAPAAERDAYDSYFKLTLSVSAVNGEPVHTVTVADGATGGDSFAVVNGYSSYRLPPYTQTVNAETVFYLKYTPAVYGSGGAVVSSATMNIGSVVSSGGSTPELPSGNGAYVQLGRVLWRNGAPRTVQDFTAGVADVRWYVSCY